MGSRIGISDKFFSAGTPGLRPHSEHQLQGDGPVLFSEMYAESMELLQASDEVESAWLLF